MVEEKEIIMKRIKECADIIDDNKFKKPCFIANDENLFKCAKDYFKNAHVEVVLNVYAPKDVCYIVDKGDYEK
jgi:hypothetical protein